MGKPGSGLVWEEHHSMVAMMKVQEILLGSSSLPLATASLGAEFPK